jgi:hypothetical protein
MECKFCNKQLSTISNLNYHIKNNKNCLEIQKNQNQYDNNNLVCCDFCDKTYPYNTINRKKHNEGIQHQTLRLNYYRNFKSKF